MQGAISREEPTKSAAPVTRQAAAVVVSELSTRIVTCSSNICTCTLHRRYFTTDCMTDKCSSAIRPLVEVVLQKLVPLMEQCTGFKNPQNKAGSGDVMSILLSRPLCPSPFSSSC